MVLETCAEQLAIGYLGAQVQVDLIVPKGTAFH